MNAYGFQEDGEKHFAKSFPECVFSSCVWKSYRLFSFQSTVVDKMTPELTKLAATSTNCEPLTNHVCDFKHNSRISGNFSCQLGENLNEIEA